VRVLGREPVVDPQHRRVGGEREQAHETVVGVDRAEGPAAAVQVDDERQTPTGARPEMAQPDRAARAGHGQIGHHRQRRQVDVPGEARRGQLGARRRDRQRGRIRQAGCGRLAQDRGDLRIDFDARVIAHGAFLRRGI
jgi:hypothetical protein